jgi:tetratricopeptide (TPR) repeat protein
VKEALAKRVRYLCSRPGCRCATVAPHSADDLHTVSVGVAAHITAAAANGPRYDPALTSADRKAAANGIWLCQTCAKLIDTDTHAFPVPLLRDWKVRAEQEAAAEIGKPVGTSAAAGNAVQAVDRHFALKIAELQSTVAATHDALDAELDETKALIDSGNHAEARPLVERLLRKSTDRLSDRQRWRAESQRALCLFAAGDFHRAGELLVAAATLLPADEKVRANEACGHELLGDAVTAHALAGRVPADFPGSLAALACWIRTAPADVPPKRCVAEAGALAGSEAEVATALAARFAFRHETEFAERAARDATRLDPEAGEG